MRACDADNRNKWSALPIASYVSRGLHPRSFRTPGTWLPPSLPAVPPQSDRHLDPWSGTFSRIASAAKPGTNTISLTSDFRTFPITSSSTVWPPRGSSCFTLPTREDLPAARIAADLVACSAIPCDHYLIVLHSRLAALIAAGATVMGCSCRTAPPGAIDPELASYVPPATILIAGLDLDRLRASPLYPKLAPAAGFVLEPLRHASRLLIDWDGRQFVFIARGDFREAPSGATLISSHLAISGPPGTLRTAIAQHKTGAAGAPDLVAHAGPIAAAAPIWAVVRGGVILPLTGNAANLNRLLHLVDYATLTMKLDPLIDLDLTAVSRTAGQAQHLEENLRAILTLAGAASPRLDPLLRTADVRRQDSTVKATLSTDADAAGRLLAGQL